MDDELCCTAHSSLHGSALPARGWAGGCSSAAVGAAVGAELLDGCATTVCSGRPTIASSVGARVSTPPLAPAP
eukprot:scaffold83107_cov33-Tisochrysis_lutea.AAC.1